MDISYNDEGNDQEQRSSSNQNNPASPSSSLRESASSSRDIDIPEYERLRQLRIEYGLDENNDTQDSVLRAILEADDRETETRQNNSVNSSAAAPLTTQTEQSSIAPRRRRIWDTCQAAPSRPGIIRIDTTGARLNVGTVDEAAIYTRRVEAIHTIQQNLHKRIGRSIERSEYEAMRQQEEEGESRMNALELLRPSVTVWDVPEDVPRREVIEPPLPRETPLPLPESVTRIDRSHQLVLGVPVTDEEGNNVALEPPLGDDEVIVRCYKNECRSALRVNMNTGLVICPQCTSISPAADLIDVRK